MFLVEEEQRTFVVLFFFGVPIFGSSTRPPFRESVRISHPAWVIRPLGLRYCAIFLVKLDVGKLIVRCISVSALTSILTRANTDCELTKYKSKHQSVYTFLYLVIN